MQFIKEDGIAFSIEKVFTPNLMQSLEVWCYTESEKYNDFSPKQKQAFELFLDCKSILAQINQCLPKCYQELCQNQHIVKNDNDSFDIDYEAIAVPSQKNTDKYIIFLLANTNWCIVDSKFCIELEMYFENNVLLEIGELNGGYIFPY